MSIIYIEKHPFYTDKKNFLAYVFTDNMEMLRNYLVTVLHSYSDKGGEEWCITDSGDRFIIGSKRIDDSMKILFKEIVYFDSGDLHKIEKLFRGG